MKEAKSKLFQKLRGENWRERHARRFKFALRFFRKLRKECSNLAVTMEVANKGEMERETWFFYYDGSLAGMWCPWSAAAEFGGQLKHIHDYTQALDEVRQCVLLPRS